MATTDLNGPTPPAAEGPPRVAPVLWLVALTALLISALAMSATQLWAAPESGGYVRLGADIAERFDFGDDLFLLRTPGYPLLLAAIFYLFGAASPTAILTLQYAMVIGTAVLTALIAWHITNRRNVALLSGLFCAGSLHLLGFACVIMSEVTYTFALTASVLLLIKYHRYGRLRCLVLASLIVGMSYLQRPMGLTLLAVCIAAAAHRTWAAPSSTAGLFRSATYFKRGLGGFAHRHSRRKRRVSFLVSTAAAILPAMVLVGPWMAFVSRRSPTAGSFAGPALYRRLVTIDHLDSTTSAAMADIRAVVDQAKDLGLLRPQQDYRDGPAVIAAYQTAHGLTHAQACAKLWQADLDLLREHAWPVARKTAAHVAWTLLVPDSSYRYVPGGPAGLQIGAKHWVRARNADVFDSATYEPMMSRYLDPYRRYLPLRADPTSTTGPWTAAVAWLHRRLEATPAIPALGISPYEAYMTLCILGILGSMASRERFAWLLLAVVVFAQVWGSAFLVGCVPRYAVPVHPLMHIFGAFVIVTAGRAVASVAGSAKRSIPDAVPDSDDSYGRLLDG